LAVFNQQIVEVALIGATGGVLGLLLAYVGLQSLNQLYDSPDSLARMDWLMVLAAVGIAVVSSMVAGVYPAWRVCNIPPAAQLKTQ